MRGLIATAVVILNTNVVLAEGAPPGLTNWLGDEMICRSQYISKITVLNLIRSVEYPIASEKSVRRAKALLNSNCFKIAELPKRFRVVERFRGICETRMAVMGGMKVFWVMCPFSNE